MSSFLRLVHRCKLHPTTPEVAAVWMWVKTWYRQTSSYCWTLVIDDGPTFRFYRSSPIFKVRLEILYISIGDTTYYKFSHLVLTLKMDIKAHGSQHVLSLPGLAQNSTSSTCAKPMGCGLSYRCETLLGTLGRSGAKVTKVTNAHWETNN